MKKTKNKLVVSLIAIMLLLVSVIGVTLAWFVDEEAPITNTFTVGNVDIILYENDTAVGTALTSKDDADDMNADYQTFLTTNGQSILPTSEVPKFTYVANIGDVNAYVGMTIAVPSTLTDDLTLTLDTTNWTLNKTATADGVTTYSYVYNNALAAGAQTSALLSKITVNEEAGAQFIADLAALAETDTVSNDFSIVVKGYAIQELNAGANAAEALNEGFAAVFNATNVTP